MSKNKLTPLNQAVADLPAKRRGLVLGVVNALRGPGDEDVAMRVKKAIGLSKPLLHANLHSPSAQRLTSLTIEHTDQLPEDLIPAITGRGWTIIPELVDERAAGLIEIDFSKVELTHMLTEKEIWNHEKITGEEKFKRLRMSKKILLDASVCLTLWNDYQQKKAMSVLEWMFYSIGVHHLDFYGTPLRGPLGGKAVLALSRDGEKWSPSISWFLEKNMIGNKSLTLPA